MFMLWLIKIWQVSSCVKFMQHLESCLLWQLKLTDRVPKGGSLEPWSPEISAVEPGALSFYWLEPWSFFGCGARSPKTFCEEPGAQHFRVSRLHWFLITAFLCLFVRVNGHKKTESEERTVHNTIKYTRLSQFIMTCNNLFRDLMKTLL